MSIACVADDYRWLKPTKAELTDVAERRINFFREDAENENRGGGGRNPRGAAPIGDVSMRFAAFRYLHIGPGPRL